MKILHLTLKKCWFDEIAAGTKKIEYREIKEYWRTRLENRQYDEIHFRNGYQKNAPRMRVEWRGLSMGDYYQIHLGRVLEVVRP